MMLLLLLLANAFLCVGEDLAFTHVAVIDTRSGRAVADQTVVIGNRITQLGPAARIQPPRGAHLIQSRGKFLIPGLWNMHVHLAGPNDPSGDRLVGASAGRQRHNEVRSMFDNLALIRKLRADIADGRIIGPRIVASGPIVDGPRPIWPGSIAVSKAEQGRAARSRISKP